MWEAVPPPRCASTQPAGITTSKFQDLSHGHPPCHSLQFAPKGRPDAPSLSWAHPLGLAGHFRYNASCYSANTMSAFCARPCLPHSPEWNRYQAHWPGSRAGLQGPHKGVMKKEAEPATSLAGVGHTGWGSRESGDLRTRAQEGWTSGWGKWLVICGKKEKKGKLIRSWGWEGCFD